MAISNFFNKPRIIFKKSPSYLEIFLQPLTTLIIVKPRCTVLNNFKIAPVCPVYFPFNYRDINFSVTSLPDPTFVYKTLYTFRNSATLTRIFPCKNNSYCINPGLYALCGAAAGLGGVTRMSVSLAVILFELTGGLTYIIPIMITIVTSKWIGDACGTSGIYDEHIRLKGYPFLDSKCEYSSTTTAREILHPQHNEPPLCVLLEKGNTVGSLKRLLKESPYKGFPLIDNLESRGSLGFVNRIDLTTAIEKISESTEVSEATSVCFTLKDWKTYNLCINLAHINTIPIQVSEEMPLDMIVDLFRKLGVRYLLVVTHGELIGLITKKDLLKHLASVYRQDPELILYY